MSWSLRRAVLTVGLVTLLCSAALLPQAVGQGKVARPVQIAQPIQKVPPQPGVEPVQPKDPTEFSHAIDLPKDPKIAERIEAAQDYIKDADWVIACKTLQELLEMEKDVFTRVKRQGPDGKEVINW